MVDRGDCVVQGDYVGADGSFECNELFMLASGCVKVCLEHGAVEATLVAFLPVCGEVVGHDEMRVVRALLGVRDSLSA